MSWPSVCGRTRVGVAAILLLLLLVSGAAAARQATPVMRPDAVGEITAAPNAGRQALAAGAIPPAAGAPGADAGGPGEPRAASPPGSAGGLTAAAIGLQLVPARLSRVVKFGFLAAVSSDRKAGAFVDVLISREAARRAHIKAGGDGFAVVGTGTIPGISAGHSRFRMRLDEHVGRQLARLGHVTLTVRLTVIDESGRKGVDNVVQRY